MFLVLLIRRLLRVLVLFRKGRDVGVKRKHELLNRLIRGLGLERVL